MNKNLSSVSYKRRTINLFSRVSGLILFFFICNPSLSQAEVELYVAGQHFKSFDDYKNNQPAADIKKTKLKNSVSGLKPYLTASDQKKWNKIAYNHEVDGQVEGFHEGGRVVSSLLILDEEGLKEAIEETMRKTKEPALLMADPTKMRIVSLKDQDVKESP